MLDPFAELVGYCFGVGAAVQMLVSFWLYTALVMSYFFLPSLESNVQSVPVWRH